MEAAAGNRCFASILSGFLGLVHSNVTRCRSYNYGLLGDRAFPYHLRRKSYDKYT